MSETYDVLIRNGHVIDPKHGIDGISDVAVKDGLVAAVGKELPGTATKQIDASGLYVTPGLLDIHLHAYSRFGGWLHPDQANLPYGVTTCVDTGSSGWQHFPDFVETIIEPSTMRVLAFINIVGAGMAGACEQDPSEMVAEPCADMIKQYPQHVVGAKSAHYGGPGWEAAQGGIDAARLADTITMVDFAPRETRSYEELLTDRMAPGDIHTHLYASHIPLLDENLKINDYVQAARDRGIIFDCGHGAGSFWFRIAVPAMQQGFQPDTISTDLHKASRMRANTTMDITMSKFLAMGMGWQEVVYRSTQRPAEVIRRPKLGHIGVGADADIAILNVREGDFGFVDSGLARIKGNQKVECRLTMCAGKIVWDDEGISTLSWEEAGDYKHVP